MKLVMTIKKKKQLQLEIANKLARVGIVRTCPCFDGESPH